MADLPVVAGLAEPVVTVLGADPAHRRCVLNGNAFQQDAIVSLNGWQYAVFYSSLSTGDTVEPLYVHVARRRLPSGEWDVMALDDYSQTVDDGHNTVQIGVCPGDGTIHLSFDHHCDVLRYRCSVGGLASTPEMFEWKSELFTATLGYLPGLPSTHKHFGYVTYPRFGVIGEDMFCSFRDGRAGLGDDHLYLYSASEGVFRYVGTHLTGVQSNPYVHGMDVQNGRLHVTWVYRAFVLYEGWDDPLDTKHKQQAGPNGAENNHNICYAYSDDKGYTWKNGAGKSIASLRRGETIRNDTEGIVAIEIPRNSGLSNQETQTVDHDGGVHVLNRGYMPSGEYMWKHYYLPLGEHWREQAVEIVPGPQRGRLAICRNGDLVVFLPNAAARSLKLLRAAKVDCYVQFKEVWVGQGLSGEPLVDAARLNHDGVLSLFIRKETGEEINKCVVVMDFRL